jgi:hypothetical protein
MKRTREQRLLDPKPGGRIAAARDYGIDLTLLVENLRLSPEKRIEKLQQAMTAFAELRQTAKRVNLS